MCQFNSPNANYKVSSSYKGEKKKEDKILYIEIEDNTGAVYVSY
jgi:hypothetical protein